MATVSVNDMEVDSTQQSPKKINTNETPNTNIPIPTQTNNDNNSNSNSMEIDTDNVINTDSNSNKENNTTTSNNSNPSLNTINNLLINKPSINNPPKRRKKRTREEMSIDMNNNERKSNTKTPNPTIKRRKISSAIKKVKPPKAPIVITPMPKKWEDKYNEYKNIIYENYKLLLKEANKNKLLISNDKIKEEIELFKSK
eukprot:208686_1